MSSLRPQALVPWIFAGLFACDLARSVDAPAATTPVRAPPHTGIATDRDRCSPAVYEATYDASFGALHMLDGSSCTHCHLADVDLLMWEQSSACQTTACYTEIGWFDLSSPLDSKMIDLVQQSEMAGFVNTEPWRYRPQHELDKAVAEYQLLTQWVDYASECHAQACPPFEQPCGAALEYGRCTEDLLVERFAEQVQPWLEASGCAACHSEDGAAAEDFPAATRYLVENDLAAARMTLLGVLQHDLVSAEDPALSRLLTKPLEEGVSVETPFGTTTGVVHTGGTMFAGGDGDEWAGLVDWVGFYHACLTND